MNPQSIKMPRRLMTLVGLCILVLGASVPRTEAHRATDPAATPQANVPTVAGDENWDDQFIQRGPDNVVGGIAAAPSGELYMSGDFSRVANLTSPRLAKWDGQRWSRVGQELLLPPPYANHVGPPVVDTHGRVFLTHNNRVVMWDGNHWAVLGDDGDGPLVLDQDDNLYTDTTVQRDNDYFVTVKQWDGQSWRILGAREVRWLSALAADANGNVYDAGGIQDAITGELIYSVARWDGATWTILDEQVGDLIEHGLRFHTALDLDDQHNLYAGGYFTRIGGIAANHIAKWDGHAWSALGAGLDGAVSNLAVSPRGTVYTAHEVTGGGYAISRWDGQQWTTLASWVNDTVSKLEVGPQGELYVAGRFTQIAGQDIGYLAMWDGIRWTTPDNTLTVAGMNRPVNALVTDGNGGVYAGGEFTLAGSVPAKYVAQWNGESWSALGSGMNGTVHALAVDDNGSLYAGGDFTSAASVAANRVARWNGQDWSALGVGMNGTVRALATDDSGTLYAAGDFTLAGGVAAKYVARWNGQSWSALGGGLYKPANTLTFDSSGMLLAGGGYMIHMPYSGHYGVARWNGKTWSGAGSSLGVVRALAVDDDGSIYAGGDFWDVRNPYVPLNQITRWNGQSWMPLGSGMGGDNLWGQRTVRALAIDDRGTVYAGGLFHAAGGKFSMYIARWFSPKLRITPSTLNFSPQAVASSSAPRALTLTNVGTKALSLGNVTLAGSNPGDFSLAADCPATLAAGASCTATVTFRPTVGGPRYATLRVNDSAPGSPHTVKLYGLGLLNLARNAGFEDDPTTTPGPTSGLVTRTSRARMRWCTRGATPGCWMPTTTPR